MGWGQKKDTHTHRERETERERGNERGGGKREKGERERRLGCSPLLVIWYRRGLTIKTPPMATMGIVFTKTGGMRRGQKESFGTSTCHLNVKWRIQRIKLGHPAQWKSMKIIVQVRKADVFSFFKKKKKVRPTRVDTIKTKNKQTKN